MVKNGVSRTIYFVFGLLAIIWIVNINLTKTSWEKSKEAMAKKSSSYSVEITEEELREFMKFWPEFKQIGLFSKKETSYSPLKPSQTVNWIMRFWFVYHRLDADRFFYVQQRLIYLLQAMEVQRNAQNIIDQLEDREDELSLQMIELQNSRIKAQNLAFNELIMVSAHEEELRELFKKYP